MVRIQVSQDKKLIYTGRNIIKILRFDEQLGSYTLLQDSQIGPFIDIKLLASGELLVYEERTSDLVKYNQ